MTDKLTAIKAEIDKATAAFARGDLVCGALHTAAAALGFVEAVEDADADKAHVARAKA